MNEQVRDRLESVAIAAYGRNWAPDRHVSAPGRIELIGNHLDYNGGPVLAAAIDRRITIAVRQNNTRQISAVFADFVGEKPAATMVAVDDRVRDMSPGVHPENYLIGAIQALDAHGVARHSGLELVIAGDLPYGVGISSSAALCVGLIAALTVERPDPLQHVALAREAENRTGSPCGAMDQSASVFGNVIRFDGRDLSVKSISAALGDFEFVLANSNVVRELGASSYPIRVAETAEAVSLLGQNGWSGIKSLAEVTIDDLERAEAILDQMDKPELARRLRHVVTETARVTDAEQALPDENWSEFGVLMTAGGRSSALNYEISHPEVEDLVTVLLECDGVLGARMMGGGEGGSALALVRRSERENLIAHLDDRYYRPRRSASAINSVIACAFDRGVEF